MGNKQLVVFVNNYDENGYLKVKTKSKKYIEQYLSGDYSIAISQRKMGKNKGQVDLKKWFRNWYIKLAGEECQECKWNKKHPISNKYLLEIHHNNGDKFDNSPENLRVLCPNCHSLTYNHKGHGRTSY